MDHLISRNNTSFLRNLQEIIKKIKPDQADPLKYYQRIVHEYVLNYPHIRGLLVYFGMGSGKTRLAAALADSVHQKGYKVIFISSKTLHGNFIVEYRKYLQKLPEYAGRTDAEVDSHVQNICQFVTLTANNMLQQLFTKVRTDDILDRSFEKMMSNADGFDIKKFKDEVRKFNATGNLDNTFVIIDESHNFFNGITNGSKNYVGLYQMIMDAKNVKLLFLTGSPITNDPFEIGLCFNMLNGYFHSTSHGQKEVMTLFGEKYARSFIGIL